MATLKWARGECIHILNEEYHRTWAQILNPEQLRNINCSFKKYLAQIEYPGLFFITTRRRPNMKHASNIPEIRWYILLEKSMIDGISTTVSME